LRFRQHAYLAVRQRCKNIILSKMPTAPERLCIICNERKPASQFERKGEHIVPRFLGNRRLRTPFVCRACNGALGGTVDLALKSAPGVAAACFNRGTGRDRGNRSSGQTVRLGSLFEEYYGGGRDQSIDNQHIDKSNRHNGDPVKNPAINGAFLKIAYESAHLRLGDAYLNDPIAASIREILSAFINKDKDRAYGLIDAAKIYPIDINAFHAAMRSPRCDFVKRAIAGRSCLNSIWIVPLKPRPAATGEGGRLAVVTDIEGLPPSSVLISESPYGVDAPELIFPRS
jgi:hypothetical protein